MGPLSASALNKKRGVVQTAESGQMLASKALKQSSLSSFLIPKVNQANSRNLVYSLDKVKQSRTAGGNRSDTPSDTRFTFANCEIAWDTVLPCGLTNKLSKHLRNDDQRMSEAVSAISQPIQSINAQTPDYRDWTGGSTGNPDTQSSEDAAFLPSKCTTEQSVSALDTAVEMRTHALDHQDESAAARDLEIALVAHGASAPSTHCTHGTHRGKGAHSKERTLLRNTTANNSNYNNSAQPSPLLDQERLVSEPGSVDCSVGQRPKLPIPPIAIQPDDCNGVEYEQQRDERVRRNQQLLAELGLVQHAAQLLAPTRTCKAMATSHKQTPRCPPKARQGPARRSARLRSSPSHPADTSSQVEVAASHPTHSSSEQDDISPGHFDDSSVVTYACERHLAPLCPRPQGTTSTLEGFVARPGMRFGDAALQRIYSVHSSGGLLVAGGHQGRMAIFTTTLGAGNEQDDFKVEDTDFTSTTPRPPLMSFKAHKGWVSEVQFLEPAHSDSTLVLSAANDAAVRLWDVGKVDAAGRACELACATHLHSSGIWSMHTRGSKVLTSSKDGSVELSVLTNTALTPQQTFCDHHVGAVKCVRHRDEFVFADCGSDGNMCVLDMRLCEPVVHIIEDCHPLGCNFVEWHASDENLLLSAGGGTAAVLHDMRSLQAPLFRFFGHMSANAVSRGRPPFRPVFVHCDMIATSGEGSGKLSLYCARSGRTVSRGKIDFDATTLHFAPSVSNAPLVLADFRQDRALYKATLCNYEPQWATQGTLRDVV